MSKTDWQKLEGHLEKVAKRCGFQYFPASTGDSQGGGDGGGAIKIGNVQFYWKFESKNRTGTIQKPVTLDELSDKVLDVLTQDNATWPEVLCLFTPHHKLFEQLERKIRVLEKKGRIPFKVVIWDYQYIMEVLTCILDEAALVRVYPDLSITPPADPELVLAKFVSDIENRTKEGLLIKNSYVHAEDRDHKEVELQVKKQTVDTGGQNEQVYDLNFQGHSFRVAAAEIDRVALKRVPIGRVSDGPAASGSVSPQAVVIQEIETVDWDERHREIQSKRTDIVTLFKALKREGDVSLFDEIKALLGSQKVVIKVLSDDLILGLVPFVYLTEQDLESSHQLTCVQIGGVEV